jgi:BTB/POZ domain
VADLTASSHSTSGIVKVFVGWNRKCYYLHRSLLCERSPFFDKCLNNPLKESVTGEVHLEEVNTVVFDQFVLWIYDQPLGMGGRNAAATPYVLADRFLTESFKNALLDRARVLFSKQRIDPGGLLHLCKNGLSQSSMAKYMWEQLAFEMVKWGYEKYITASDEDAKALHELMEERENMVSLMRALDKAHSDKARGGLRNPSETTGCQYHEHKQTKSCEEVKMTERFK